MALNWKHIKGLNGASGATGPILSETEIEFANPTGATAPRQTSPTIKVVVQGATGYELGHIITDNASYIFDKPQSFNQFITFSDGTSYPWYFGPGNGNSFWFTYGESGYGYKVVWQDNSFYVNLYAHEFNGNVQVGDITTEHFTIHSPESISGTTIPHSAVTISGPVISLGVYGSTGSANTHCVIDYNGMTINKSINASFFNATSDARIKENLQPVDASVLPFIKKLPLYTYNYKTDPSKIKSIGVLAQDMIDLDINGFKFIDHLDADGKKQFLELRESKLVFLLLKAIQELQEEIDTLKKANN